MNKYYHQSMKVVFAKICVVLAGLATLIAASDVVLAQRARPVRTPLPDVYQEYIYNLNQFYNDRKLFESDKSKYLAYKTVQSREDALESTVFMLESSRIALVNYIDLLSASLQQQDEINSRVKNALLADLQTHKTFLTDSQSTIQGITTLEDSTTVSNALQLRYTYIKSSATQALTYIDAVRAKQRNDKARQIVTDFQAIVTGYPPDNKNREVVEKWALEILPELADNDNLLNELVESMYLSNPQEKRPVYEVNPAIAVNKLMTVNTRQQQYIQKFKEINQIARQAYQEL